MKVLKEELFKDIPAGDEERVDTMLAKEREDFHKKIIVLDDDPTGVQSTASMSTRTGRKRVLRPVLLRNRTCSSF